MVFRIILRLALVTLTDHHNTPVIYIVKNTACLIVVIFINKLVRQVNIAVVDYQLHKMPY